MQPTNYPSIYLISKLSSIWKVPSFPSQQGFANVCNIYDSISLWAWWQLRIPDSRKGRMPHRRATGEDSHFRFAAPTQDCQDSKCTWYRCCSWCDWRSCTAPFVQMRRRGVQLVLLVCWVAWQLHKLHQLQKTYSLPVFPSPSPSFDMCNGCGWWDINSPVGEICLPVLEKGPLICPSHLDVFPRPSAASQPAREIPGHPGFHSTLGWWRMVPANATADGEATAFLPTAGVFFSDKDGSVTTREESVHFSNWASVCTCDTRINYSVTTPLLFKSSANGRSACNTCLEDSTHLFGRWSHEESDSNDLETIGVSIKPSAIYVHTVDGNQSPRCFNKNSYRPLILLPRLLPANLAVQQTHSDHAQDLSIMWKYREYCFCVCVCYVLCLCVWRAPHSACKTRLKASALFCAQK